MIWTVIGDSFSRHGGSGASHLSGIGYQDAGRPPGNLLMIPARLAMALKDDGWLSRHEVVWDKGWVRPEAAQTELRERMSLSLCSRKIGDTFTIKTRSESQWLARMVHRVGTSRA